MKLTTVQTQVLKEGYSYRIHFIFDDKYSFVLPVDAEMSEVELSDRMKDLASKMFTLGMTGIQCQIPSNERKQ